MELVLKFHLLCSHLKPESRPSMRHVVHHIHGDATLPGIPFDYDDESIGLPRDSLGNSFLVARSIDASFVTMSSIIQSSVTVSKLNMLSF